MCFGRKMLQCFTRSQTQEDEPDLVYYLFHMRCATGHLFKSNNNNELCYNCYYRYPLVNRFDYVYIHALYPPNMEHPSCLRCGQSTRIYRPAIECPECVIELVRTSAKTNKYDKDCLQRYYYEYKQYCDLPEHGTQSSEHSNPDRNSSPVLSEIFEIMG